MGWPRDSRAHRLTCRGHPETHLRLARVYPFAVAFVSLAVTVIERASNRAIRVSYKPTLQKQVGASAFITKRGQGIEPDDIPEAEHGPLPDGCRPQTQGCPPGRTGRSLVAGCARAMR